MNNGGISFLDGSEILCFTFMPIFLSLVEQLQINLSIKKNTQILNSYKIIQLYLSILTASYDRF